MPPIDAMLTLLAAQIDDATAAETFARSARLLDAARDGTPRLLASIVRGSAVVLGARQRAGRVVDLSASSPPVLRRATTGREVHLTGRSIVWSLALPRVDALFEDARPETLLNRNVRALLKGLVGAGAQAGYFGRDHIAIARSPAVALGYELTADGRVLIEAIAGYDAPVIGPDAPHARAPRTGGRAPVALASCVSSAWSPERLARQLIEAAAVRVGAAIVEAPVESVALCSELRDVNDPLPSGATPLGVVAVPIGFVEGATGPWFGGDALTSTAWLDALADAVRAGESPPPPTALEGARVEDLLATLPPPRA